MAINESKCLEKANKFNLNTVFKSFKSLELRQKWSTENKLLTVLTATAGNFATTAAGILSSSNFTSARRHRRLPSSDLKQANVVAVVTVVTGVYKTRNTEHSETCRNMPKHFGKPRNIAEHEKIKIKNF